MLYFCWIIKLSEVLCPIQGDRRKAVRGGIIEEKGAALEMQCL